MSEVKRIDSAPTSTGATPPAPNTPPLPRCEPGAAYPGTPATVGKPKPAGSRPTTAYGAPSLGAHLDRIGGAR